MSRHRFRVSPVAVFVLLLACESGSGANPEETAGEVTRISSPTSAMVLNLGASGSATYTIERTAGYNAAISLGIDGVPNGVTASFSTPVLTFGHSSSILNVVAVLNATPGTYPLTVRASAAGMTTKTTTLTLTIPTPTFNIQATTSATTLALEQSLAVQVTSTRTGGGFIDAATLSATGLPPGVTATFSPAVLNETVTSSTMTLTPALGTPLGPITLGIRATALGAVTQAPPLQLTIVDAPQPTYRLLPGLPMLGVLRGGASGQMTISIPRGGGLTAPVALALEGAPAGTVATFVPNNSTGTSAVLSISVPAATPAGNIPVTVRGTTPSLADRTATFTLQVQQESGVLFTVGPGHTMACGQTRTLTAGVQSVGGYGGTFTLTSDPLPAGITVGGLGGTRTLPPGGVAVAVLDLIVAGICTPGSYNLTFRLAGAGGIFSSAIVTVVLTPQGL